MKCPKCGAPVVSITEKVCAFACGHRENGSLIDPAELKRLIEKAEAQTAPMGITDRMVARYSNEEIYDAVKSYLDGDPSALERLAGEEQVQCPQCTGYKHKYQDTCDACAEEDSE